ncbi:MAG: DUF4258 domain-containing protein [Nitrososphaerota archaeon]|nr:DUF4258 domain-containing protein [Nitrososphaerota archaeon]
MFERILNRMRDKVRTRDYIIRIHADEEREADGLSVLDVEHCIISGEVTERQRDKNTKELKYRIAGTTISGHAMEVIAKLGPTGKFVIITVYLG